MERCVCKSLRVPWAAGGWVQFSLSSARDAWVVTPVSGAATDVARWCYSSSDGVWEADIQYDRIQCMTTNDTKVEGGGCSYEECRIQSMLQ